LLSNGHPLPQAPSVFWLAPELTCAPTPLLDRLVKELPASGSEAAKNGYCTELALPVNPNPPRPQPPARPPHRRRREEPCILILSS